MKRALVTDHTTGETVAEVTLETVASARGGIVLPGARAQAAGAETPPTSGRTRVEVVLDGWRFDLDVEDADRAALRARAMKGRGSRYPARPDRCPSRDPGASPDGRGRTRGRRDHRSTAPDSRSHEDAERAALAARRHRGAGVRGAWRHCRAWRPAGRPGLRTPRPPDRPIGEGADPARDRWRETLRARALRAAPERRPASRRPPASRPVTCTRRPIPRAWTRIVTSGGRASTHSRAVSSRPCIDCAASFFPTTARSGPSRIRMAARETIHPCRGHGCPMSPRNTISGRSRTSFRRGRECLRDPETRPVRPGAPGR